MRVRSTVRSVAVVGFLVLSGGLLLWPALTGSSVQAQSAENAYADVPEDAWYHESVEGLRGMGILEGTDCEEGFCPGDPLKRWQMAVWLVRLLDGQDPALIEESRFEDVDDYGGWVHFIERLAELEVTGGCRSEPPSYCPERSVTRAQMAAFLYQALDLPDAESPAGFVDVSEDSWAFDYVNALAASKITGGCKLEPFSYCPSKSVTKAQMAAFLYQALSRQEGLAEEALSNPNNIPDYDPDVFYTERNQVSVLIKQEIIDKYSEDNPWLLRAWNHTNRPDFEYMVDDTRFMHIQPAVIYSRQSGEELNKIKTTRFSITTRHLDDRDLDSGFVHELAHVYTYTNGISARPEALAAAQLYFADLGGAACLGYELYADAATLLVPIAYNDTPCRLLAWLRTPSFSSHPRSRSRGEECFQR